MITVTDNGIIRRRQVEEPRRYFRRIAITARHHRGARRICRQPVSADVPCVRLTPALAHHWLGRHDGEAPPLLLNEERCADLHQQYRRNRRTYNEPSQK